MTDPLYMDPLALTEQVTRRSPIYRERFSPLERYTSPEFKTLFRFEKHNFLLLADSLRPQLQHLGGQNRALSPIQQLAVALGFYATGNTQMSTFSESMTSQSCVSDTHWRVTQAINTTYPDNVIFTTPHDVSDGFRQLCGIPNVKGALDGTHIQIEKPHIQFNPVKYLNRKSYYSINTMLVCTSDHVITQCLAQWPGSSHDSRIFKSSAFYDTFVSGTQSGTLLADSGYAISPFVLTPFIHPTTDREKLFNTRHKTGRVSIEQTNGEVKKRFHCVGSRMRIKLDRVPSTIRAVCVLHNLAKQWKDPVQNLPPRPREQIDYDNIHGDPGNTAPEDLTNASDNLMRQRGQRRRQDVVEYLWNNQ